MEAVTLLCVCAGLFFFLFFFLVVCLLFLPWLDPYSRQQSGSFFVLFTWGAPFSSIFYSSDIYIYVELSFFPFAFLLSLWLSPTRTPTHTSTDTFPTFLSGCLCVLPAPVLRASFSLSFVLPIDGVVWTLPPHFFTSGALLQAGGF